MKRGERDGGARGERDGVKLTQDDVLTCGGREVNLPYFHLTVEAFSSIFPSLFPDHYFQVIAPSFPQHNSQRVSVPRRDDVKTVVFRKVFFLFKFNVVGYRCEFRFQPRSDPRMWRWNRFRLFDFTRFSDGTEISVGFFFTFLRQLWRRRKGDLFFEFLFRV